MENQNDLNQECGCGEVCCAPQKSSPWKKWALVIVLLAVGVIITIKLAFT